MVKVQRIMLDILKPHSPNGLEFSIQLAEKCPGCRFNLKVLEVDEKTETVIIIVESESIPFNDVSDAITSMGGSIHSIDEVDVIGVDDSESSSTQTNA
ncbi:MAG: DUF211 domain-containing protein [gamma proteobacterium symbiont of Bathyaustriella thionipta]|nr:DUF211 domain-containing protein [gamma proteobacterium symbiont of Bathyaustriella thionipta]MCU7949442.1 DUF211 domain-containing protein [gamma proteobacterium symbiont of Bathyaustriella thionipta]MCU7954044.1 DUF211 domain-containing protein [gamma proteobacterium symbiont of Bathyaustriella thionipta]MCU7956029.1 DUF211 domain-containing protein [gamma proteobacterium symbiont of Bathyaustriella thionipta]MCU7966223.1 DUF211 domain-containing protein [gamma proteobacterium symbiont of 